MEQFRFLKWQVYKEAKKLFRKIFDLVQNFPTPVKFHLGGQLIRASFSIVLNIAEGSGKTSDKELQRYLDISLGSCYELLASLDTLKDSNLITEEKYKEFLKDIESLAKQLGGFKKFVKNVF